MRDQAAAPAAPATQTAQATQVARWLLAALTVAQVVGCAANSGGPAAPRAPTEVEPPEAVSQTVEPKLPPGTRVSFAGEVERMERVRQLPKKRDVLGLVVKEDDLIHHVETMFRQELPADVLAQTEDLLIGLGSVPRDFNFEKAMLGLLRSQLAGLYDPKLEAMFVRAGLTGEEAEATLFHELVHALQDQHYQLDALTAYRPDQTDQNSAISALAEGDAMSAMFDAVFEKNAADDGPRTALDVPTEVFTAEMGITTDSSETSGSDVPELIQRSLVSPYIDGLVFVHGLRRKGGWASVDGAWKQLPDSTEQVLHLEKFLSREAPIAVQPLAPGHAFSDYQLLLTDIWGEQSLRLTLEEWMSPEAASSAAAGWGGDRIAVYGKGDARLLTWHLVCDDAAEAAELFEALRKGATKDSPAERARQKSDVPRLDAKRHPLKAQAARAPSPGQTGEAYYCRERGTLGPERVLLSGQTIAMISGPYARGATSSDATCDAAEAVLTSAFLSQSAP